VAEREATEKHNDAVMNGREQHKMPSIVKNKPPLMSASPYTQTEKRAGTANGNVS
jgi:hypothetical protein